MKLGTPIIGGSADGETCLMRIPRMSIKGGDVYMLVSFRDKDGEHYFYQSAGATPEEALKKYKERFIK